MMQEIIAYARTCGARQVYGDVLTDNASMLEMARELGFERSGSPEHGVTEVTLNLDTPTSA